LSDSELVDVIAWAQGEQKVRAEKKKQDTIAKIRELAGSVGVAVHIDGTRGRPPKSAKAKTREEA
jgi:hypothetical protein